MNCSPTNDRAMFMLFFKKMLRNKIIRNAYLAWFSIALFYFYQYTLRVSPNVLENELRTTFKITAAEFGSLGSLYMLAYAILQIPLGIVVDRLGVKIVATYSIFCCIFGTLLFSSTEHFIVAQIARFLIGAGSASAFMCSLKFIADHFPPGQRGFLMGATLAIGTAGSALTARSLHMVSFMAWHDVMLASSIIGLFVLLMITIFVKNPKEDAITKLNRKNISGIIASVFEICKNFNIIIYAILAIGLYTPLASLADVWGSSFIKQKFHLNSEEAALTSIMLYVGLTIGSIVLPWFAEKRNMINQAIIGCSFAILVIFCLILYLPPVDTVTLKILFFILGFLCGAEMMCFTGALIKAKSMDSGEIIGVVNTLNMLTGAFLEQIIGWSLDLQWDGAISETNLRVYSTAQFETALSSLTIVLVVCCLLSFFLIAQTTKKH
jgi:sugar phosphate permease